MASIYPHQPLAYELTENFPKLKGLTQGDGMTTTLLNLDLEYVIRQLDVGKANVLTNKSTQISA